MEKKWLKVSECLPDEGQIVLCFGNGIRPSIAKYTHDLFERFIDTVPGDVFVRICYIDVTHWHPLPEIPIS